MLCSWDLFCQKQQLFLVCKLAESFQLPGDSHRKDSCPLKTCKSALADHGGLTNSS